MGPMSVKQFMKLLSFLNEKYHPIFGQSKMRIKYVIPGIDLRNDTVYHVKLVGYGWEKVFTSTGDSKDPSNQLYNEVLSYLIQETGGYYDTNA